ncbi:MAG: response regulator [Melioribacteraceae bacterium]|nr:response regulator [Melioribacteraceae bacterium]MDD3557323.1 response regulator [Melioribacteraceae bacterium]
MIDKAKILIIDDEEGLRLGTKRLLELEDYFVDAAENGSEGIKLGTTNEYDLAFIDLKMPDYDGIEVLKKIKEARPNTVCYIATAYASYDTAVEATRIGAYGYIPKPFTPDELLYSVEKGMLQRNLLLESERLKLEREKNLLELASEKSRLKTILNSIAGGVLVVNRLGKIVYFNNAALKLADSDKFETGKPLPENFPEELKEIASEYLNADIFISGAKSLEIEIKPNQELVIQGIVSHVPEGENSFAGVVIVLRNITEAKKIEHIKNQFVSMVAHELKAPVSAVIGFLQLSMDENVKLPEEKKLEFMQRSTTRLKSLLDLVNDLLDISRMEINTKQKIIEPIDLKEILNSTLELFSLDIKNKNIVVEKRIDQNLSLINMDKSEISRVFTNLISNAVKYNHDNGKIVINISNKNNFIEILIKDSGIGLREEEREKIFTEFFRAKNKFTKSISGTGLGLSIVKRIVDSYNGKIRFESEYEKGTTFIIQFPIND